MKTSYDSSTGLISIKKARPIGRSRKGKRFFDLAKEDDSVGWDVPDVSADAAIYPAIYRMVARARDLARNNDYVKQFLRILTTNVVGWKGFKLQSTMRQKRGGSLDRNFNRELCKFWCDSQKMRNFPDTSGTMSGREISALWLRSLAVDGEVIVIARPGYKKSPHRYSLQFVDAMRLDWMKNEKLNEDGHRIKMGVEMDADDTPIAYHFLKQHPNDNLFPDWRGRETERIEAKLVSHTYLRERPGQTRGITWLATPAMRAHMYEKFEEAVVVGARVAASKMGFYKPGEDYAGDAPGDDEGVDLRQEVEAGMMELLPRDLEVGTFDPNYPPANLEEFAKTILRGLASGLGVDYVSMANNLEGVNYSSIRHGLIEQRALWRCLQDFQVEHFEDWRFRGWAEVQTLQTNKLPVAQSKFDTMLDGDNYAFRGRGWTWVDPLKEVKANREAIAEGFTSRRRIIEDTSGDDVEDIFDELAEEKRLMEELDILPAEQEEADPVPDTE